MRYALIMTAALAPAAALSLAPPATTAQGAYSAEQAADGATLYAGECAMCHGKQLEGTLENPALKGGRFLGNWAHVPVAVLSDYIHRAMPQMAPGTLSPENTVKVVAYLLQQNDMPAGKTALPIDGDALKRIPIEPPKR